MDRHDSISLQTFIIRNTHNVWRPRSACSFLDIGTTYRAKKIHVHLVNIAQELATDVLATCLLVVKDAGRGRLTSGRNELSISRDRIGGTYKDDDTKATSRKEQVDPVLNLVDLDVVSWRNDTSLVQATIELNNDLPGTVIVNNLELADVA